MSLFVNRYDESMDDDDDDQDFDANNTDFQRIRDVVVDTEKTFCSGTYPVSPKECILFYGKESSPAGRIDLSAATDDELANLARVCDPATFGHNQADVLDESYRKARKLDTSHFASNFNLHDSGLTEAIRSELLEGEDYSKSIYAELYKLNVYDRGAFFKAHKDTPRSDTMFGSLVVVFPTPHEGGALVLRHAGKEWSFDSAKAISDSESTPSIAYIGFFSDVEHEVTPVTSGHRVTLTYNLYFSAKAGTLSNSTVPGIPAVHPSEEPARKIFSELLANSAFLPEGGKLGFGLNHQYPFSPQSIDQGMIHRLKGSDALIFRICRRLSLQADIRVVYKGSEYNILCSNIAPVDVAQEVDNLDQYLIDNAGGLRLVPGDYLWKYEESTAVGWVTKMNTFNTHTPAYIAYGNQASVDYMYGRLVLIVEVGPVGDRATRKGSVESKLAHWQPSGVV